MLKKLSCVNVLKNLSLVLMLSAPATVFAELGEPEKDELTFGFIKLTDMAPIAIAYENGYFDDGSQWKRYHRFK